MKAKNLLQCLSLGLLLTFWVSVVSAQGRKVTGTVSEESGGGIPGVSVSVKGTTKGTITDGDGKYTIDADANSTLVFSSIGYLLKEVKVGSQSVVNVSLESDAQSLSEVVVTGYTVDNRRETTGSVSIVQAKDLVARPSGNVEQQLQGRVAGVTVVTNGQPGTASQVRVRGFGSFGGNEPLYVVDGVPTSSTNFINPNDVETVTVLKDAAAASIYGARAASGVIVYTTKKGTKGAKKLSVSYDGLYGATDPGKGQAMMNPTDFAYWTNQAYINSNQTYAHPQFGTLGPGHTASIPDYINVGGQSGVMGTLNLADYASKYNVDPKAGAIFQVVKANKAGTDWYDAVTRVAPMQRHSLGFSGGGERSRFYVDLAAQNQQGILLNNSFNRYSLRSNSEFDLTKKLRIGENFQMSYISVLGQGGGSGGQGVAADENDVLAAFRMPSIIPIYDEFGGYAGTAAKGFNNPRNPVASRDGLANNRGFGISGFGNIYAEFDVIPGLTVRSSLGGGFGNSYYWNYGRLQYENSENNSAFSYGEGASYSMNWVLTNTAQYKKAFGQHSLDVLVGQEALNTGIGPNPAKGRSISASGLDPFSTDPNYVNMSLVGSKVVNSSLYAGVNFYSLFGRVNYIFNDKYILTGVIRRDGSSVFGANNRYGIFPAFSAAWRVSSEKFMKDLPWVNDLKIRGGYGTMGNSNNVLATNQYSIYQFNVGRSVYDINGTNSSTVPGYYRTGIGNPNAKWETSITKNIGLDGNFFNGKLDLILDFWQKDTKDLLMRLAIPATNGFDGIAPTVNTGSMTNKGIDILVGTKGKIGGEVGYDVNITAGFIKNEIIDVGPGRTYLTDINPGFRGITPIRNQLGYSISSFYGYKVMGLFQSQAEVDGAAKQSGAAPGRFRYEDLNGDGVIDANDRTYLGSPVPKVTLGSALSFTYKNFDLYGQLYSSIGNKIFNVSKWFTDFYPSYAGAAISERVKDSWLPTNTDTNIPIFETASNFSTNTQSNSFYVEDGSYLRLQTITLGYTVPASSLSKLGVERLRIYAGLNNVFTITKYQGLDPGVGGNADTNFGIDVGNYPITRSWNVGINLGF